MKTLEQACEGAGIEKTGFGLKLHFSPIPNWYGCILGFDCPICDSSIDWEWEGEMPPFTNEQTISHLKPKIKGAWLKSFGHRWISLQCKNCETQIFAENFD